MRNKIVIDGKEFALPDSLVNEIKEKLSPKEPTTFEECVGVHKEGWKMQVPAPIQVSEGYRKPYLLQGCAVPSEKRANQLAAIAKMMTVADALNGETCYTGRVPGSAKWESWFIRRKSNCDVWVAQGHYGEDHDEMIMFKTRELAHKAIQILGESTIKTAFGL